jgi:two-component system chemotaxis sensor kinase CheA
MIIDLSQALTTFFDESRELLTEMESILLSAEQETFDSEQMNALFRCAHTIKGSAGMFGLDAVVRFTHEVETLLDRLRHGDIALSSELVSLLLETRDHMAHLLDAVSGGAAVDSETEHGLISRMQVWGGKASGPAGPVSVVTAAASGPSLVPAQNTADSSANHHCWHISLRFETEVLRYGFDPLSMINFLKTLGDIVHVETVSEAIPEFSTLDPEQCFLGFEISFRSNASKSEIANVFEFVSSMARIAILPPHSKTSEFIALIESLEEDKTKVGELLVACGTITNEELAHALSEQSALGGQKKVGEVLVAQRVVAPVVVDAALAKQRKMEETRAQAAKSVKVPADRLDALIDQVGELVIAGAATQIQARRARNRELQEAASNLLRLVEDVRDTALRLRMTPIGEVFSRFPRVVRDVAKELGKDIELKINGAEAELDKSMIEKIGDPLMHLVRNSMDHGIESPEVRTAAGKPARGTVSLNAYHESGSIVIEVADDGGGLNTERIFRKAVDKGLVSADANLAPADIYRLILEPGFSTAEQVTNLSGRGVGMDVVRSSVEALRGTLDIESTLGAGTTIRICLPLTLAIIDGFQVGVGSSTFILPLDSVVECIELPTDSDRTDYLNLRGEVLPFLRLRRMFNVEGKAPPRQNIVVVRFSGRKAGIVVDRLFGECQTVIKPLGRLFAGIGGISGSTILGSGEVALILDVAQLVQGAVTSLSKSQPTASFG